MAVLPWGHNRSNTNSSTEKVKGATLDWLSRSSTEPSRQAINQLMKQHSRGTSGGSVSLRNRSRAGTPNSQHHSVKSIDSKPGSGKGKSVESSVASQSRPETPLRPSTSGLERSDSASKSLFQRGGLLRRKGSKMTLATGTNSEPVVVSPRSTPSRAGLRGKDPATSPTSGETYRPSISMPFDFTHVMHGDLNAFTGLGRIDESDLASQFDAIQARYRTTTASGEPFPSIPQTLTPTPIPDTSEATTALPQLSASARTGTPPPAPPPKDSPPAVLPPATDIRTSRSTENFSRPTPRSPTASTNMSLRPSSCHLQQLTNSASTADQAEVVAKPLPQLPTVIHAVSTEDDTARLLISAPLPSPPANLDKSSYRHHRQSSSRGSLRHMSTFPSSRHPQNGSLSHDGQLLGIKEEDGLLRPHSDYELNQRSHRDDPSNRASLAQKQLQVEDWEMAIDSAWDFEDEADSPPNDHQEVRPISSLSKTRESLLTIEQTGHDEGSSPSTPLMTMAPARRSRPGSKQRETLSSADGASSIDKRNSTALVGLGIGAADNAAASSRVLRLSTSEVNNNNTGANTSPRLARSAYSAISHSSSQESIIWSIASSIMSTQRSSVSSVSVSDCAHTGKSERLSTGVTAGTPLLSVTTQKAARPESTCLPATLLQQANLEVKGTARPDSNCLPASLAAKRNSAGPKQTRPGSQHLPDNTLATFPVPEATSRQGQRQSVKHFIAQAEKREKQATSLLLDENHSRAVTGALNSISYRSSIAGVDCVPTARQRSSTQGSRTRQSRVSYSLFPTAGTSTSASSHVDVDGVAS